MSFDISVIDEYILYNYTGIDYIINKFINEITTRLSIQNVFYGNNSKKYFNNIIRDLLENLENMKFSPPYILCNKYLSIILSEDMMPEEAIIFLKKLNFEKFVEKIFWLLNYEKEYYIIIGNLQSCANNTLKNICFNMNLNNMFEIIETLNIDDKILLKQYKYNDPEIILLPSNIKEEDLVPKIIDSEKYNFKMTKNQFNNNEINNCVIDYYLIKKYKIIISEGVVDIDLLKQIIKQKLIYSIISDLLNEPLFDKIRTTDKIGYVVKSIFKFHSYKDIIKIFICYLVQSTSSVELIYKSINNFNIDFYKDFNTNSSIL